MIPAYTGAIPDKATMDKDTFANSINPYLTYIDDIFVPEVNALETNVNAKEVSAVAASAAAVAAANFQGTWTNQLTSIPQAWEYDGVIYGVLVAGTASPITTPSNWFALTIAQAIKNTPAGNISATTVQAAINELDTEKAPLVSAALTGTPTLNGNLLQTQNFRNKFVNGDFGTNQINGVASTTVTAGAELNYITDQWYAYCTGANVTTQRVSGSLQSQYRQQFTGAASVTKIGFAQRMEAGFTYDMNGKSAMIGVDMSNSLLTTVTWTAWYANTADIFGTRASPTRTQIATGTITVSSNLNRYYIPIAIPSAATTGIEIEFSVGAQISGTWVIGNAQFEKVPTGATTGTDFEVLPLDVSLSRCQRYFETSFGQGGIIGADNQAAAQTGYFFQYDHSGGGTIYYSKKRTIPTVVIYAPLTTSSSGKVRSSGGTIYTVSGLFPTEMVCIFNVDTGVVSGYQCGFTASARL